MEQCRQRELSLASATSSAAIPGALWRRRARRTGCMPRRHEQTPTSTVRQEGAGRQPCRAGRRRRNVVHLRLFHLHNGRGDRRRHLVAFLPLSARIRRCRTGWQRRQGCRRQGMDAPRVDERRRRRGLCDDDAGRLPRRRRRAPSRRRRDGARRGAGPYDNRALRRAHSSLHPRPARRRGGRWAGSLLAYGSKRKAEEVADVRNMGSGGSAPGPGQRTQPKLPSQLR